MHITTKSVHKKICQPWVWNGSVSFKGKVFAFEASRPISGPMLADFSWTLLLQVICISLLLFHLHAITEMHVKARGIILQIMWLMWIPKHTFWCLQKQCLSEVPLELCCEKTCCISCYQQWHRSVCSTMHSELRAFPVHIEHLWTISFP